MLQPQTGKEKFKVFISYSRSDIAFADQLVEALNAYGFEPLIDRHDIAGGEEWKQRLHALILEAELGCVRTFSQGGGIRNMRIRG